MAEENNKNSNENETPKLDFRRYVFANVASKMAKNKADASYLSGAVDLLESNLDFGIDGVDLYRGFVNEKTLGKFIDIYNEKHYKALSETKISELASFYEPAMEGATDEQKELMRSALSEFGNETYGDLSKKILRLSYKAQNPENEEEAKKANKELQEKYGKFNIVQSSLEGYMFENLRYQAIEASKKNNFGDLEKILKQNAETSEE
jgi:hypothetical protein